MNKPCLNILLSILIIAALSTTIVSAEYHHVDDCRVCHDMSGSSNRMIAYVTPIMDSLTANGGEV